MAIAHVQSAGAEFNNQSSQTATLGGTTPAGNLIIVFVSTNETGGTIGTPTDNSGAGNTYTPVAAQRTDEFRVSRMWYTVNGASKAGFAVTVTLGAAAYGPLFVHEVSGQAASPLDVSANNYQDPTGTATDGITSTAATTTTNGQYIFAATHHGSLPTTGTGFTTGATLDASSKGLSEYQVQSSAGSIAGTFTASSDGIGSTWMATFKAAGGGGSSNPLTFNKRALRPNAFAPGLAR